MSATLEAAQGKTAQDLLEMPGDFHGELVNGELRQMAPAGFEHGAAVVDLTGPLSQHIRAQKLGIVVGAETGFQIGPNTVRAPDIAFVSAERIAQTGIPAGYFPGAPDLAVEVVSLGDRVFEVDEKVEMWLEAGTLQVWVVNPRRRVVTIYERDGQTHTLRAEEALDGGTLLPGFHLPISEIFPSP